MSGVGHKWSTENLTSAKQTSKQARQTRQVPILSFTCTAVAQASKPVPSSSRLAKDDHDDDDDDWRCNAAARAAAVPGLSGSTKF